MRADDPGAAPALLRRLGYELDALADTAARIQSAVGAALQSGGAPGAATLADLQEIDRLQQTLEDIAFVLARAGDRSRIEEADLEAIAREVRLERVADLVTGRDAEPREAASGAFSLL